MVSVQERLKLKRAQIDTWSVREQLCLASSVLRSGDQNWMSVSRSLKAFGDPGRPADWFSQKSCAVQYSNLLENVETPKRKKRSEKGDTVETPSESIVRRLTQERIEELKRLLNEDRGIYLKLKDDITQVRSGSADDRLAELSQQLEEDKRQKDKKAEAHEQWLKEREEKKLELERAWKPPVAPASPLRRKQARQAQQRSSSQSEPGSEADSAQDSPLSEPLNVEVSGEESATEATAELRPAATPTSPLLTSLLKSPSPAPSQSTSLLHSAITAHRGASPTITSLLSSAPGVPGSAPPPGTVSPSLKHLVSSAIGSEQTHGQPPHPHLPASAAGAVASEAVTKVLAVAPVAGSSGAPPEAKDEPIEVLIEEVVVNDDSVIESGLLTAQISDVLVASTTEEVKPKDEKDERKEHKEAEATEERSEAQEPVTGQTEEAADDAQTAGSPHELTDVGTSEAESELAPGAVAEVIEISEDQEGTLETEVVGRCVQGLEDMEVIILDKVQGLDEVQIVEDMKALECEVVEVVMGAPDSSTSKAEEASCTVLTGSDVPDKEPEAVAESAEETSQVSSTSRNEEDIVGVNDQVSDVDKAPDIPCQIKIETEAEDSPTEPASTSANTITSDEKVCVMVTESPQGEVVLVEQASCEEDSEASAMEPAQSLGSPRPLAPAPDPTTASKPESDPVPVTVLASVPATPAQAPALASTTAPAPAPAPTPTSAPTPAPAPAPAPAPTSAPAPAPTPAPTPASTPALTPAPTPASTPAPAPSLVQDPVSSSEPTSAPVPTPGRDPTSHAEENSELTEGSLPQSPPSTEESRTQVGNKELKLHSTNKERKDKNLPMKGTLNKDSVPEHSSKDIPKKDTFIRNKDSAKDIQVQKKPVGDTIRKTNEKDVTVEDSNKMEEERKGTSKEAHQKDEKRNAVPSKKDEMLQEMPKKDAPKLNEKTYITSKEKSKDKKEMIPKEINKEKEKDNSFKDEPKPSSRDASRKDTALKDVHKRNVKEPSRKDQGDNKQIPKEIPKDTAANKKEALRRESMSKDVRENQSKDNKKEVSSKDSNKEAEEERSVRRSSPPKDVPKRDTPIREGSRKEVMRRESKDEVPRKEATKRTLPKEEKRESVREEQRKRLCVKDVFKKDNSRRVDVDRRSDSIKADTGIKTEKIKGNEGKKEEVKTLRKDRGASTEEKGMNEGIKIKEESSSKDFRTSVSSRGRADGASENKPLTEKETREHIKSPSENKAEEAPELLDEKPGKRTPVRVETPSTEDDKTNDAEASKTTGRRRLLDSVPSSPASTTDEEREYRSWKKSIMLLYGRLATHKYASLFLRPITDDQAPGYSSVVHRPIDLLTIKKNIETGVIRTTAEFQRDVMLMFINSIMYNKSSHFVHNMARQMQAEGMQHIQDFLATQMLVQAVVRRETRTTEANKQRDLLGSAGPSADDSDPLHVLHKRKRNTASEPDRGYKKKKVDE